MQVIGTALYEQASRSPAPWPATWLPGAAEMPAIKIGHLHTSNPHTEYGLQASIWTRNLRVAHMLARKIKAGTICINNHNYGDPAWPFGGYKQSGWGREMGKDVMEHYTETKSVAARL